MSITALAFFTGLFGSLHCAAMCGPLVMSLPLVGNTWWFNFIQRILYQSGRILMYSIFGFIAGSIGKGFDILNLQQLLSLISGTLLVGIAISHFSGKSNMKFNKLQSSIVNPVASLIGRWLSKPYGGLFAGAVHGLLPCGMVYMALAASLNTGTAFAGSKFMLYFGLGTTPMLLLASLTPVLLRRFRAPKLMLPVLFIITGIFLISRGLNLDVPYISAPVIKGNPAICK